MCIIINIVIKFSVNCSQIIYEFIMYSVSIPTYRVRVSSLSRYIMCYPLPHHCIVFTLRRHMYTNCHCQNIAPVHPRLKTRFKNGWSSFDKNEISLVLLHIYNILESKNIQNNFFYRYQCVLEWHIDL